MKSLIITILITLLSPVLQASDYQCEINLDVLDGSHISNFKIPKKYAESNVFTIEEMPRNKNYTLLAGESKERTFEIFLTKWTDNDNILNFNINLTIFRKNPFNNGKDIMISTISANGNSNSGASFELYNKKLDFHHQKAIYKNKFRVDCRKYEHRVL